MPRETGPPLAAAASVAADWSPFLGGALVLVPVGALLWGHRKEREEG